MPVTATQNIPPWLIRGFQACANDSEMSDADLGRFFRHTFIGPQSAKETIVTLNTDATKEAVAPSRAQRNSNAETGAGTGRRARTGSRREELINLIREGDGLSRGEILERMDLKGNKPGEMSVSNALTALTKRNQVRREGGKYLPVPA